MDKRVKIKLIGRMSLFFPEYTPISMLTDPRMFILMDHKFEKFENWPETIEIRKEDFENALAGHEYLQETYIEIYSNEANYYACNIYQGPVITRYYILKVKNEITMLFYRHVKT